VPATPPPPAITRLQPPPPSVDAAAAPSLSSAAGGNSATGTGTGVNGSSTGAAAVGAGSGAGMGVGGPGRGSGRGDEYLAQLRRWIMRYHRYPDGARAVGVATVAFQIAADGTVSHIALERSSGDPVIDRDAVTLLHRASPVPAPPPERLAGGHVEVAIPVEYEPGFFERLFR
jgi:protein TonB